MTRRTLPPRSIEPFDGPVEALVVPPGSKSITNRALLAAALARGRSTVRGVLHAEDTEAMLDCISGLGASVEVDGTVVRIEGVGGRPGGSGPLGARQSGTTARFIAAALAMATEPIVLDADPAMRRRPMGEVFAALRSLGVSVDADDDRLPATITGPIDHTESIPVLHMTAGVSSQFVSGLLLAAPTFPSGLRIDLTGPVVSRPYLDMTIAVMRSFGAHVETSGSTFVVAPHGYDGADHHVEPDASAASYFFGAAAITGGVVTVEGLGAESLQGDLGFVDVLTEMGCSVERTATSTTVRGGLLRGVHADLSQISDTAQTAAVVAVFAEGPTTLDGIGFIRNKETDRIAAMVTELRRVGIEATELDDGIHIVPGSIRGTTLSTYDDHRMAMSLALLGLREPGIVIDDPGCVSKTFPNYFSALEGLRPEGPT